MTIFGDRRVYLAARYGRKGEIDLYADWLRRVGLTVTSSWHAQTIDEVESKAEKAVFAQKDLHDLVLSNTLLFFTEPKESTIPTSGRHVEFGYAYARKMLIVVVGDHLENVFQALVPADCFVPTLEEALVAILHAKRGDHAH